MSDQIPDRPIVEDDAPSDCSLCKEPLDDQGECPVHGDPFEAVAEERAERELSRAIERGAL